MLSATQTSSQIFVSLPAPFGEGVSSPSNGSPRFETDDAKMSRLLKAALYSLLESEGIQKNIETLFSLIEKLPEEKREAFILSLDFLKNYPPKEIQEIFQEIDKQLIDQLETALHFTALFLKEIPEISPHTVPKILRYVCENSTKIADLKNFLSNNTSYEINNFFNVLLSIPSSERDDTLQKAIALSKTKNLYELQVIIQAIQVIPSDEKEIRVAQVLSEIDQYEDAVAIRRALGVMNPVPGKDPEKEWEEFINRVDKGILSEILQKVDEVTEQQVDLLVDALEQGKFTEIFSNQECHFVVLQALKRGKISLFQAASLLVSLPTEPQNPERIALFDAEGKCNQEAVEILRQSYFAPLERGQCFPENQFQSLLARLEKEAAKNGYSEYWITAVAIKPGYANPVFFMDGAVQGKTSFSKIFTDQGKMKKCIPSFAILQADLEVQCPYPVRLNPVLGLSTDEQIEKNGTNGTRDAAIPFPGIVLPEKADGFLAPDEQFTAHDYFHATVASYCPPLHRSTFILLARSMRAHSERKDDSFDKISSICIDMQTESYSLIDKLLTLREKFQDRFTKLKFTFQLHWNGENKHAPKSGKDQEAIREMHQILIDRNLAVE